MKLYVCVLAVTLMLGLASARPTDDDSIVEVGSNFVHLFFTFMLEDNS